MVSNDPYPTAAFPTADETAKRAHKAYREHILAPIVPPDLELIERQAREAQLAAAGQADTSTYDGEAKEPEASKYTEARVARDLVRQERENTTHQRWVLSTVAALMAVWLSAGLANYIGPWAVARFPFAIQAWVYSMFAAAVSAVGLHWVTTSIARNYQLTSEGALQPTEIPHLSQIANVIRQEEFQTEDLTPGQQKILDRKLQEYNSLRRRGKRTETARMELFGLLAAFVMLLVAFVTVGFFRYGHATFEEGMISFVIAFVPAVALSVLILRMAEVSLDIPQMYPFDGIAPEELARRAASEKHGQLTKEGQRSANHRAILKSQASAAYQQATSEHRKVAEALLLDLRAVVNTWEKERGFTLEEQAYMEAERQHLEDFKRRLYAISIICALVATYPASITLGEALNLPFDHTMFTGMTRFCWWTWGFWFVVVLGAEFTLVSSLTDIKRVQYAQNVLLNGYDEVNRRAGLRYVIKTQEQAQIENRWPRIWFTGSVILLLLEFAANIAYMIRFSDVGVAFGAVLAVVPFTFLMVSIFPLLKFNHSLSWLNEALGRQGWRSRLRRGAPPETSQERRESALEERAKLLEEGYRGIGDRRNSG